MVIRFPYQHFKCISIVLKRGRRITSPLGGLCPVHKVVYSHIDTNVPEKRAAGEARSRSGPLDTVGPLKCGFGNLLRESARVAIIDRGFNSKTRKDR